jgi:hypothetical protein
MTSATERLRASDRRGGFPLGADPLALHRPSGTVECGRGDSFGRSRSPRDRRFSLRGGPTIDRKEPDRAETPCLPPTFGSGDAKAVRAARRNVQQCWAARLRGSVGNESIQSPREHRADARRQRRTNAPDSSVEEGPEVESSAAHGGDTDARAARTARGHAQPVNAIASERTRRGDGMVRLPRRGTLRRVTATGDDFPGPSGPRPSGRRLGCEAEPGSPKLGEPHGRLRGATNPRTVERVDLRICSLRRKPLEPGGTARAERARDVAVPSRSPGDGLDGSGRSDGRVDEGAKGQPQERSPERRGRSSDRPRPTGPREPECL